MRKALWEVPEQVTGLWIDLLRVQAGVVREQKQLLHQLPGLVPATGGGERRDEPERAGEKRPLLPELSADAIGTRRSRRGGRSRPARPTRRGAHSSACSRARDRKSTRLNSSHV